MTPEEATAEAQALVDAVMEQCDAEEQPIEDDTYHLDFTMTGERLLVAAIATALRAKACR